MKVFGAFLCNCAPLKEQPCRLCLSGGTLLFWFAFFFPNWHFTGFLCHHHYHIIYLTRRQRYRDGRWLMGWGGRAAPCVAFFHPKTGARSSRITVSAELEWPGALCSAHMLNYFKRTAERDIRCLQSRTGLKSQMGAVHGWVLGNSWDGGGGGVLGSSRFPWEYNSGKIMKHSGNQWSFYWNTYRVTREMLFCVLGHSGE